MTLQNVGAEEERVRKGREKCMKDGGEVGEGRGGGERGSMNNPLKNHDRIKTMWEPKISPAQAAWRKKRSKGAQHDSSYSCCQSLWAQEVQHLGDYKKPLWHCHVQGKFQDHCTFYFLNHSEESLNRDVGAEQGI